MVSVITTFCVLFILFAYVSIAAALGCLQLLGDGRLI